MMKALRERILLAPTDVLIHRPELNLSWEIKTHRAVASHGWFLMSWGRFPSVEGCAPL
jgi:hypothetical protein